MKRQKFRFGSRCRDDVGEFQIAGIEIALCEDGTVQSYIEIWRTGENGRHAYYPDGVPFVENYTLPAEAETVSCWRVLEY